VTNFQLTDTGDLIVNVMYPTEHLSLHGSGEIGDMEIAFNRGEFGGEALVGIRTINITAWGTEKNIEISGITIEGDLTIRTGFEGDIISLSGNSVRSKLKIVTGRGDDYIGIYRMFVGERAAIITGDGDDYVSLSNLFFLDSFRLLSEEGADVISLSDMVFNKNANVKTGTGFCYHHRKCAFVCRCW